MAVANGFVGFGGKFEDVGVGSGIACIPRSIAIPKNPRESCLSESQGSAAVVVVR
jgi:hypothetical protein